MGMILCETHGWQGVAFACPHVSVAVHAQKPCEAELRRYGLADDPELADVEDACVYCSACVAEHNLPPDKAKISYSFWEGIASLHRPVCVCCFKAWKISSGKYCI
jgi:hypothetical protein